MIGKADELLSSLNKNNYELVMDLPGYDKKDIKMHIEDGYLIINASTKNDVEDKDKNGKYALPGVYYYIATLPNGEVVKGNVELLNEKK